MRLGRCEEVGVLPQARGRAATLLVGAPGADGVVEETRARMLCHGQARGVACAECSPEFAAERTTWLTGDARRGETKDREHGVVCSGGDVRVSAVEGKRKADERI